LRTDVIVGAASGMGAAIATCLAGEGRRLLLADVDVAGAEEVAERVGGDVEVQRCDLAAAADVEALAMAAPQLGVLVVAAGLSPSMAPGRRIFEVDLIGPAHAVRAFQPNLDDGSVGILFASMAAHLIPAAPDIDAALDDPLDVGFFDRLGAAGVDVDAPGPAYAFAKRGVVRLVQRQARGWGANGARLLSLSPGIVDTPMGRLEAANEPAMAAMVERSALGRMLQAEEIAAAVAFLVSPAASALTGTDVLVDGGAVASLNS
jgi:NAD(P)-dependent dehydrogenase (short-subunit alcohol dehydrogenase family)